MVPTSLALVRQRNPLVNLAGAAAFEVGRRAFGEVFRRGTRLASERVADFVLPDPQRRRLNTLATEAQRLDPMARHSTRFIRRAGRVVGRRRRPRFRARRGGRYGSVRRRRGRSGANMGLRLPMQATLKFKTCAEFTMGLASNPADEKHFVANGVFRPLGGTNTSQPFGFDQWSAFYERYTVYGTKIKIRFRNRAGIDIIAGMTWNREAGWTPNAKTLIATKCGYNTRWKHLAAPITTKRVKDIGTIQMYRGIRQILQRGEVADETMSAVLSANPASQLFCHAWVMAADSVGDIALNKVDLEVTMIQYTLLKNRTELAESVV